MLTVQISPRDLSVALDAIARRMQQLESALYVAKGETRREFLRADIDANERAFCRLFDMKQGA
jgi:hypothetical protein